MTIAVGTEAVNDREYFEATTQKIIETREWTKKELKRLGFEFGDSKSNFIFAKHPKLSGEQVFEDLKKAGIYVRHFKKPERISEYLRITIGTDKQMETLISCLEILVNKAMGE